METKFNSRQLKPANFQPKEGKKDRFQLDYLWIAHFQYSYWSKGLKFSLEYRIIWFILEEKKDRFEE